MKKLLQTLLLLPLFVLGACGGGGGEGGPNSGGEGASKPVNSRWVLESNTLNLTNGIVLDLRDLQVNTLYNKIDTNGVGISFIAAGSSYGGTFGLAFGTGCSYITNDISCTEMLKQSGSYTVSSNNKLTLHITYSSIWDGYDLTVGTKNWTETYR